MRPGRTRDDGPIRPSSPTRVILIDSLIVNVCTEAVWSRIALVPGKFNPRRLSRCELATTTSRIHSGCHNRTRRYGGFMGTLPPLWQRQNDVNCALAAQRRTTAASPTRAAADPTLVVISLSSTLKVYRARTSISRGMTGEVLGTRSESGLSLVHPSTKYQALKPLAARAVTRVPSDPLRR
jgi:hypothetical protein